MGLAELAAWAGTILSVMALMFGLYKWGVGRADKRRQERNDLQDRTLDEHRQRLDRHTERLNKMDDLIGLTREDLHRNYPRIGRIESMEKTIDDKLDRVHSRLTAISRDLNQAIGNLKANHENEITHLVAQIRDAIGGQNDRSGSA